MSTEEMRHCAQCGMITPHEVISNRGIVALLCHSCFGQWANQSRASKKYYEPKSGLPRKEILVEPQNTKLKPKTKISYYEIVCEACNLSQFYHGKSHMKCIHCMAPLDLRKLKPRYQ